MKAESRGSGPHRRNAMLQKPFWFGACVAIVRVYIYIPPVM